jgi:NAD(P)-dependent dehydrogenase (short-subunit alcohol dehydrogenase family)
LKRIFITGASSGIGLLTAGTLCQGGHLVWGTSRTPENLPGFDGFRPVALDLDHDASIDSGFGAALREAGRFDVLINNAGAGVFGPLLTPYSAGKAALSALSEGLNLELSHTAIKVVDVRPGDFATRFHASTRRLETALADGYAPNLQIAWGAIDRNMARAPDPQLVADAIMRIVNGEARRPVVAVGDFFQARVATYLARRSARAWVQWGLRAYYGLKQNP